MRLPYYDYASTGAYFITICTYDRTCLFGDIRNGAMHMNALGYIVESCWNSLPDFYSRVSLDEFVVMPNHVHGVLFLKRFDKSHHTLSNVVRAFKSMSARQISELRGTTGLSLWQRNYYEHIIRDDEALTRIREYVIGNPAAWSHDRNNPNYETATSENWAGRGPAPTNPAWS